jgi:putative membrane protein
MVGVTSSILVPPTNTEKTARPLGSRRFRFRSRSAAMVYLWVKSFHVLFVIAWMATVFYLPRILVNLAEVGDEPAVKARLLLMGQRLYKFGHGMFGMAFLFGLALWQGWRLLPSQLPDVTAGMHWIDAKLALVALLLAYFLWTGRLLKRCGQGGALPSAKMLRVLNELPVLLLLGVIFLVLAKPF